MNDTERNKTLVRTAFRPWEDGDSGPIFDLIDDRVRWTVIGSTAVSGTYQSKQALVAGAFGPLLDALEGPLATKFVEVAADGDRVFLRFESYGDGKNRVSYDQTYCWAMTMRAGRIVEITAYLDTDLLVRIFS